MDNKEIKSLIDNAIIDAHYVKDDAKPSNHIYKILKLWTIIYSVTSLAILIYNQIGTYQELIFYDWFYPIVRVGSILLFSVTLLTYVIPAWKMKGSLKEKDFLKFYSIIPISLVLSRLIYPLSYYINSELLVTLYKTIPLDSIIIIIGSVMLNHYYKAKFSKRLIILNIILIIVNTAIFIVYTSSDFYSVPLGIIENISEICRNNGLFIILNYVIILKSIKKMVKNYDYDRCGII